MLERFFERILWNSRFFVILAVVSSLLLSITMFVVGFIDVIKIIIHLGSNFDRIELIAHSVAAIDGFLLATILLIFSLGLYELFISKIDEAEESQHSSGVLMIKSLDDLKEKLAKVILMVLVVTFFESSLKMSFNTALELIYFAIGILFVSLALYFTNKKK
ncbi:membrane protein [hydrothermal vent metagenome]|uniref:Membrane protein n=1 Tax=hydrothermal vent metagenome TaxID=652676 RepID=A0A1W1CRI8_9ZZZZ